jgi:hypothetical protein
MGADLAAIDLARFLRDQRITETSTAFIFTRRGEVIALPDATESPKLYIPTVGCWSLRRRSIR